MPDEIGLIFLPGRHGRRRSSVQIQPPLPNL